MSKKTAPLIPPTGKAPQPKPQPIMVLDMASVSLLVMQINDMQRGLADKVTQLYNEIDKRQAYINSLPKPEEAKA